jgi:hypothetical protein
MLARDAHRCWTGAIRTSENCVNAKFNFAEITFHALRRISLPIPLSTRLPAPVAAKIILLGDVPIRTILYAVLVVGVTDRRTHTRSLCP